MMSEKTGHQQSVEQKRRYDKEGRDAVTQTYHEFERQLILQSSAGCPGGPIPR